MEHHFDVVIYGGTASGVIAAVAAAQEGLRVALVEPGRHVGGMVSGGLSHTDYGDPTVIRGLALEFYERVARHYAVENWTLRGPEPHVAEQIFRDWLREAKVELFFNARLDHVKHAEQHIRQATTECGHCFVANVFIDASYEGDLLARAQISYSIGREGVEDYGESWAGRQPSRPDKHNFSVPVSPFVNGADGELLPLMHQQPMVKEGAADHGVQAYCFRLCLTDRPDNRLPFPSPEQYDPSQFELLKRYLAATEPRLKAGTLMSLTGRLPNDKIDVNSIGPISTNLLDGSSWEYPDADYTRRQEIWDRHLSYTQGLLFFLTNDPDVPAHIRTEMNRWGLCRDEFTDTGHWPHQLYIREARRMRGEYLMTQADLEDQRTKYDAVALGSYNIDIREVQRVWIWVPHFPNLVGETVNEGYLSVPVKAYEIPYRSLVPKYHECTNLLVSVCVSASHVAYSSIRMEPQYMMLGHAAGLAAALAVKHDIAVQRVNIVELQAKLRETGGLR
jgi:hypothetical protein